MEAREIPFPAPHVEAPVLPVRIIQSHRDTADGGLDMLIDIVDTDDLEVKRDFPAHES